MKRILTLLTLTLVATLARAQDIAGDWQGTLSAGGAELRLVLHITQAAGNSLKATLDSIDQGANGAAVDVVFTRRVAVLNALTAVSGAGRSFSRTRQRWRNVKARHGSAG